MVDANSGYLKVQIDHADKGETSPFFQHGSRQFFERV